MPKVGDEIIFVSLLYIRKLIHHSSKVYTKDIFEWIGKKRKIESETMKSCKYSIGKEKKNHL